MSLRKSKKLLVGIMLAVILSVSGYFVYDVAIADHSRDDVCYDCHTLKASDLEPNTSSLLPILFPGGSGAAVQNTALCEVCHSDKQDDFSPVIPTKSMHPVHIISNYDEDYFPNGYWSYNNQAGYPDDTSPFVMEYDKNAIECFNCHNSNQVTDRGPNLTANGYPDHTWELEEHDLGGVVAVTNPPPYDYLRYHLYGILSEGSGQGGGGADDEGDYAYDNANYNTCFGGADILNKKQGTKDTIWNGETGSTGSVPGCHGNDSNPDRIQDTFTKGAHTGFSIQEYYEAGGDYVSDSGYYGHYVKADGGKIACYECHDAHSSLKHIRLYDMSAPNLESKTAMLTVNDICRACHGYATSDKTPQPEAITNIDTSTGADQTLNPMEPPDNVVGHMSATEQPCYLCHNAHNPDPDLSSGDCEMCHIKYDPGNNDDYDNYDFGTGDFADKAMLDGDQWTNGGHGTTGNLPANNKMRESGQQVGAQGPDLSCIDDTDPGADSDGPGPDRDGVHDGCHITTVAHGDESNPFRLMGGSPYEPMFPDAVCFRALSPEGGATPYPCHGNPTIDDAQEDKTAPHRHEFSAAYTDGVCYDCHDPHGDTSSSTGAMPGSDPQPGSDIPDADINTSMMHRETIVENRWGADRANPAVGEYGVAKLGGTDHTWVVARYEATGKMSDPIENNSSPGYSGICEVCHVEAPPGKETKYFRRDDDDGDPFPPYHDFAVKDGDPEPEKWVCVACHEHSVQLKAPRDCRGCHSIPQPPRPQIVYEDGNGNFQFYDNADGQLVAMSKHFNGTDVTSVECIICHLEGKVLENPAPDLGTYYIETDPAYHDEQAGGPIDLRDMATGDEAIPTTGWTRDANTYDFNAYKLNSPLCGGCHDANGAEWWAGQWGTNAMQPFNNSSIKDIDGFDLGGDDTTPVPDIYTRYSSTGVTTFSKFSTATYNVVPQLAKAYSPHGNPVNNDTKNEVTSAQDTPPFDYAVACMHCHTSHGSDNLTLDTTETTGYPPGTYSNLGANPDIMALDYGEPYLCWNCHSVPNANVPDFYGDTSTAAMPLQWGEESGSTDMWTRAGAFAYKSAALTEVKSIHGVRGLGKEPEDNVPKAICSVCHDPHGIDVAKTQALNPLEDFELFLVPSLRVSDTDPGGWLTSPYKEDCAPTSVSGIPPENPEDYSSLGWDTAAPGTYAWWSTNVGPRVEPYNSGGVGSGMFDLCNPPGIGGGYGDSSGGGTGNYGFFINDNTFGTSGAPIWLEDGAATGPSPIDFSNAANDAGGPGAIEAPEIYGFCQNCHTDADVSNIGGWRGHASVYGETAYSDCLTAGLALEMHGGPKGKPNAMEVAPPDNRQGAAGNKWAINVGNGPIWQQTVGNAINYHQFSCSKCHTPHASVLDQLMRTNCLSGRTAQGDDAGVPSSILTSGTTQYGNYTLSATTNREGYGFPSPPAVQNEMRAMHCHNSFEMAEGGSVSNSGTNADAQSINYDAGWLSPWGSGTPKPEGPCNASQCHKYYPNYETANTINANIPSEDPLTDPVIYIIRSGAHRVHLDLAYNNVTEYPNSGWEGYIDTKNDGLDVADSFGLGNPGVYMDSVLVDDYLNCDWCHEYEPGSTPPYINLRPQTPSYHRNGDIDFAEPSAGSTYAATTVCNPCHDPQGADGNSATAKANWGGAWSYDDAWQTVDANGFYLQGRIRCLSCHDRDSDKWSTAGGGGTALTFDLFAVTDVQGANIKGDDSNQGFFKNGHGADKETYTYEDGDPGANFRGLETDDSTWDPGTDLGDPFGSEGDNIGDDGCIYCHDMFKPHIDGVDDFADDSHDFRIEEDNFPTVVDITDVNEICNDCHEPDGGPYGRDNLRACDAATYDNAVPTHTFDSMTFWDPVAPPDWPELPTKWATFVPQCHDCHDLHGSTNYTMLGSNHLGKVPTANTTNKAYMTTDGNIPNDPNYEVDIKVGTYELGRVAEPWGPCVICHDNADHNNRGDTDNWHELVTGDMSGKRCTDCHLHVIAFIPLACDDCHGFPPGFDKNDPTGAADSGPRGICIANGSPKVGPVEDPCNNIEQDVGAPENGAHSWHTTSYRDDPNPLYLGLPKISTCLDAPGCHKDISEGSKTDHQPGDDIAEVDFDILDNVSGDPVITKEADGDMLTLGDGSRDRDIAGTADGGGARGLVDGGYTPNGTGGRGVEPVRCVDIYCHSNVQKNTAGQWWNTNVESLPEFREPSWNDPTSVVCGDCHGDSRDDLDDLDNNNVGDHDPVTVRTDGHNYEKMGEQGERGSHLKHVRYETGFKNYAIVCQNCHYQEGKTDTIINLSHANGVTNLNIDIQDYSGNIDVDIVTNYTGTAKGIDNENNPGGPSAGFGQCTTIYCHSRAADQDGVKIENSTAGYELKAMQYATPTWGIGAMSCNVPAATGANFACHGNTWDDSETKSSGSGYDVPYGGPDYMYTIAEGGGPGSTYANSHFEHLEYGEVACKECHASTIDPNSLETNPAIDHNLDNTVAGYDFYHTHVNAEINVNSATYNNFEDGGVPYNYTAGISGTPHLEDDVKRCYNSCHETYDPVTQWADAPQWGGPPPGDVDRPGACLTCHKLIAPATEAANRPVGPTDGTPNKIDYSEYLTTGHGRDTGSTYSSGRAGAGYIWDPTDPYGYDPDRLPTNDVGCISTSGLPVSPADGCHSFSASGTRGKHRTKKPLDDIGTPPDNFFLGTSYKANTDGLCISCHINGISFAEGKTHSIEMTGSTLNWDAGQGGASNWGTNPPKCVDCHDPHGDTNDYMVKSRIAYQKGSADDGSPITPPMQNVTFILTGAGQADDYYNTTPPSGICQVCHSQNLVYNRAESPPYKPHRNNTDDTDDITNFLPDDSPRRCPDCHWHYGGLQPNDRGFKIPSIEQNENTEPVCTDCHVWDSNGDSTHPLMVLMAAGGLRDALAVSTDGNDDVDNYLFGTQPPWIIIAPDNMPQIADYSNRAMIDTFQWSASSHGTKNGVGEFLLETSRDGAADQDEGPGFGCLSTNGNNPKTAATDGCHDDNYEHGNPGPTEEVLADVNNKFRLVVLNSATGGDIIEELCESCHGNLQGPGGTDPMNHDYPNLYPAGQCTDCHDPHGDSANNDADMTSIPENINTMTAAMIQREVVTANRWPGGDPGANLFPVARFYIAVSGAATGTDFVKNNLTYSGICEACHTADPGTQWFRQNNSDGITPTGFHAENCTNCHRHPDGFQIPPIDNNINCEKGCHANDGEGANATNTDVNDYDYGVGAQAFIDYGQWLTSGHGNSTTLPETSLGTNSGPGFGCATIDTGSTPRTVADTGCHDETVNHGTLQGTNPFRLVTVNSPVTARDYILNLCKGCHDAITNPVNHTDVAGTVMYEEVACTDCHDPHGDSADDLTVGGVDEGDATAENAAMIQKEVVSTNRWVGMAQTSLIGDAAGKTEVISRYYIENTGVPAGTDFVENDLLFSGICEVCHTESTTPEPPGPYTMFFRKDDIDGDTLEGFHNGLDANTSCTVCHTHNNTDQSGPSPEYLVSALGFEQPARDDYKDCGLCHIDHSDANTGADADNDDRNDYTYTNRIWPVIDLGQWTEGGHGNSTDLPPTSQGEVQGPGNPLGQNWTNTWGAGVETCTTTDTTPGGGPWDEVLDGCHDDTIAHGLAANPFRLVVLGGATSPKDIVVNLCIDCHGTNTGQNGSSPSNHVDLQGVLDNLYTGGACTDCHDPHGDSADDQNTGFDEGDVSAINAAMIQKEVVTTERWASNGFDPSGKTADVSRFTIEGGLGGQILGDFYEDNAGYSGICEVCHTATTDWFRQNDGDGQTLPQYHQGPDGVSNGVAAEKTCTTGDCHLHANGFQIPTGVECYSCHKAVVTQFAYTNVHDVTYTIDPINDMNPWNGDPSTLGFQNNNIVDCLRCHDFDSIRWHMRQADDVELDLIEGIGVTSQSAYTDIGDNDILNVVWGDIKDGDATGAWCAGCHDADGVPSGQNFDAGATAPNTFEDDLGAARYALTGHGAVNNASGNFTRVVPNISGRSSCTGCHTYHGHNNPKMVTRMEWTGAVWNEPVPYPTADDGDVGTIDTKEKFCLDACHLSGDAEWSDVITARTGANLRQGHFVKDYAGNLTTYENRFDTEYFFVSKAIGFTMGQGDLNAGGYVADQIIGEAPVYEEDMSTPGGLRDSYNLNVNDRALCTACHDPHGSEISTTWGYPNMQTPPTDDQMLVPKDAGGVLWDDVTDATDPCDRCHM